MKAIIRIGGFLMLGLIIFSAHAFGDLPSPGAAAVGNSDYVQATSFSLPMPTGTSRVAKHLSLKEAILLALRNNPDVESSELQRVVDKFALEVAHNAFYPQLSIAGTSNFANSQTPQYSIGPKATITTPLGTQISADYNNPFTGGPGNATVTVTQPLLKGAGLDYNLINLLNVQDNEVVSRLAFKNSIITVVISVINSYRALVQDYNNLDIQGRTLLRAQQTVQQTKLRVQAGQAAPSDLLQQQTNLVTTQLSIIQQKGSLGGDYQRFLQSLGLIATAKVTIDKKIELSNYQLPSLKRAIRLALENNINYQSAVIRMRATERALVAAKNQNRWQLDVTASTTVGQNTGTTNIPASTSTTGVPGTTSAGAAGPSVGFTLNIPINDVNGKQAVVSARVALEQAKLSLEEQKQQLIRDVTDQLVQLRNQLQEIQVAVTTVGLQEKNVANAQIKLKYGRSTVFEVNQLQDQLLQQQTSIIGDKIRYLNQITTFSQTLGTTLDDWGISLRY